VCKIEFITKWPNWLRYTLAIPFGIALVIIFGLIIGISNLLYLDPNSSMNYIINFAYANGINIIIFFWAINSMLPKYRFQITLTISILFGIFYCIVEGMSIITNNISLEYIIAFIEIIVCLIISCYMSFKKKFNE